MPGKSKNQVVSARIAEGIKKGTAKAKPGSPSAQMAKSMSLPSIKEFAATPTGGLPKRAKKKAAPKLPAPGMMLPPSPAPAMPRPPSVQPPTVAPATAPPPPTVKRNPAARKPAAPPVIPAGPAAGPATRPPIFGKTLRKKNAWR